MAKSVLTIPATRNLFTTAPITTVTRRKVAGYARVSTDSDEQFTSYEAQVGYYTNYIRSHPGWDFIKLYADEGISAVTTKHRDGFNEMIADALAGRIDLIVTKSVSRFARNTVDSLTVIRELKAHGVEVFFEKEGIFTFDSKGELLITIMSSLAQEESRNISENTTWGHRRRMESGKASLAYSTFLGYDKGEDGALVVNEKEAEIVRLIYRKYMEGMAPIGICHMLEKMHVPTPRGKNHWYESTILSILSNEKYKGDLLMQKTFTVDFLTKKHKKNEGELQQYYVPQNHEAIIPPEEFDQVQAELARRKQVGRAFSGNSPFSSKIVCGDCGAFYGSKIWHSNDPYRKVIWRCNRKYGKGERCTTPTLSEGEIKFLFTKAFSQLLADKDSVIEDCETLAAMLEDTIALDRKITAAQAEVDSVLERNKALIREHAVTGIAQEEFDRKASAFEEQYQKADAALERLIAEKQDRQMRAMGIRKYVEDLQTQAGSIGVWDEQAWRLLVTQVTVHGDGSAVFLFRGENRITILFP